MRGFVEGMTYADNGDFFDGIFGARGLVFGVLGHGGWIDRWECINDCDYGERRVRGISALENVMSVWLSLSGAGNRLFMYLRPSLESLSSGKIRTKNLRHSRAYPR